MNEFVEQFVLESREYVEQATADLLTLEKEPAAKGVMDSAFRAFHTLKGSAGIIEFTAMVDAVHGAEDVLSSVRSGERRITTRIISDCLACLDQIARWLQIMESTGELPIGASAQAQELARRFTSYAGVQGGTDEATLPTDASAWAAALLSMHPTMAATAGTAVRYVPDPDCFFEHEDPFGRIADLPGLLAVAAQPATPWPSLDELDPLVCNIVIAALTRSASADVIAAMGSVAGQCEVVELDTAAAELAPAALTALARQVLLAQVALIQEAGLADGFSSRLASAGVVAANVLRHARRIEDVERLERSAEHSLTGNSSSILRSAIESVLGDAQTSVRPPSSGAVEQIATRTLRVDSGRVDKLVNVTGELTVAKNAIGHIAKLAEGGDPTIAGLLKKSHAVLDNLVAELQRFVLGMRVLPLRHVFARFPRLLREMGSAAGKPVDLLIEGGETEADKSIVEMLFEPLLHVLRNAMDHGIEDAATRRAVQKPAIATIVLRASRVADNVLVEVQDDGRGIDLDRVRRVALERKLVAEEALTALSDDAVIDIIFEPGFSTAAQVTDMSGRGVGMDAVRTAVRRLGGQVTIQSQSGRGTKVCFTLPFSVMMTRIAVVTAGDQLFGIPIDAVVETLRVNADRIAPVGTARAMVLRNRTVPVIVLAEALGLPAVEHRGSHAAVVVVTSDGNYGGLCVDRIGERMEVMLKPLEGLLAGTRGIAGSTLLGDGSVLLVLDIGDLLE